MKAMADSQDSLVLECDLDEPPEKVWRALTEPRLLEAWLGTDQERSHRADAKTGLDRGTGHAGSADYEILTAEPNRRVRYRWRDRENGAGEADGREVHSVVTVELAPCPAGGTHLRLTHGEFTIVAAAPAMATTRVRPITSARRLRTPVLFCAAQPSWRRAA